MIDWRLLPSMLKSGNSRWVTFRKKVGTVIYLDSRSIKKKLSGRIGCMCESCLPI
jgi:hypothetical protein